MKKKIPSKGNLPSMLSMDHPAFYQIRVQGRLDQIWSERLAGMSVTTTGGKDILTTTMLEGRLLDQAALTGILTTLYDLQLPLLSVECIES